MSFNAKSLYDNNEILPYKDKIMSILLSSPTLYELVTTKECEDIEQTEALAFENYVPQLFVDETITETQGYVLFDISEMTLMRQNPYVSYDIYFHVFVHKGIWNTKGYGTRSDCIVAELCRLFKDKIFYKDGSIGIGKNTKLHDQPYISPNSDYLARELVFRISDYDERVKMRNG